MIPLAVVFAAGAATPSVLAVDYRLPPPRLVMRIVPGCGEEEDAIVVCARRPQRIAFDPAGPGPDGRRLDVSLRRGVRLSGGGPRGSVGLGLTIDF